MKKVVLTRGLPACGKSTWCHEFMKQHPGQYKRITKDLLREMSDFDYRNRSSEKHIVAIRNVLILYWLEQGFSLLIDDTNFNPVHVRDIRELVKGRAIVSIQDFTHVPLEECIKRDLKRPNSVGEREIRKMHRMYLWKPTPAPLYDETLPSAIICDLDGTLALHHGRNPYDTARCEEDLINDPVRFVISDTLETSVNYLLLVSGRRETFRPQTERWLKRYAIPYHALFMRAEDDDRSDATVKREIYEREIAGKFNVRFVLDDRNRTIEVWRSFGLPAFQVADGDF